MKNSQTLESVSRAFADLLVAKIESMTQSWHKPWISGNGSFPYNVVSGRSYTGTNALTLLILTEIKGFMSPAYLTFRQAKELGLGIRKGSRQFPVVFWKPYYAAATASDGHPRFISAEDFRDLPAAEQARYKKQFALRYYLVLNLDQTDFAERYPERWEQLLRKQGLKVPQGAAHPVLEHMLDTQSWVCPISLLAGDAAFYIPSKDCIVLPRREQFSDLEAFYSTLLHEMSHSTGAASRLNRHLEDRTRYGREELVAEFSAALAGYGLGVFSSLREENAAYLKGWLEQIREDPKFLFSVLTDVQNAVRYIGRQLGVPLLCDAPKEDSAE